MRFLFLALAGCSGDPADTAAPADTDPADTDTDTDTVDTADTDTAVVDDNAAPTAPAIAITPSTPPAGADFTVVLVTPSDDPDGDTVTYRYAWTVDGAPAAFDTATILGADAALGQRWEITVTPNDGALDGPAATAAVVIGNAPPTPFTAAITPTEPRDGDDLTLTVDPVSTDPDGDPLTTTIRWYKNDSYVPFFDDLLVIPGSQVGYPDTFRAVVSVTDGYNDPVTAEATVALTYSCTNLPPFNLGDATLSDARAYHGVSFDDDGNLLGYDGRGSLVKSAYDGTRQVFLPGVGTVQQIDRFPNGDWVYADNDTGRLVRMDAAGGTTTLATDLGIAYGVVVGPDEQVYVTYPDLKRVDPSTGAVTTLLSPPSGATYHVAEFNLDSTVLFLGTIGSGDLYSVPLDADLNPIGTPTVFASRVGSGWHDGIGIDTCGNLYVADYSSRGLYRVEPDATVTSFATTDPTAYGHGLQWGSGIGGWRTDTLYLPQPYNGNTVREVVLGFGTGDSVRTWNGVAVPW